MSNTTKTKMVPETQPGNRDKEDNAEKGRSLSSRKVNYTVNEKTAIKKKIKSCREVPLQIKICERDISNTTIIGRSKRKGNRHM